MSTTSSGLSEFNRSEPPPLNRVHRTVSSNAADLPSPRTPSARLGSGESSTRSSGNSTPSSGNGGMDVNDEQERAERVMVTLQAMLKQERIFYERKCKEYVQNPSVRVKDSLTESEQRIAKLEQQLGDCTRRVQAAANNCPSPLSRSSHSVATESQSSSFAAPATPAPPSHESDPADNAVSSTVITTTSATPSPMSSVSSPREKIQPRASSPAMTKVFQPSSHPVRSKSISTTLHTSSSFNSRKSASSLTQSMPPLSQQQQQQQQQDAQQQQQQRQQSVAHIYIDDEDVDDDVADDNSTGPFSSLDSLVIEPASMAVFIRYLLDDTGMDSYPDALFFYLLTGIYNRQRGSNAKETRRFAQAILGLFFAENAPLHVDMEPSVLEAIRGRVLPKSGGDESLQGAFNEARYRLANGVISSQLESFRDKRALGLGNLFGEAELVEKICNHEEKIEAIRKLLVPLLGQLAGMDPSFSRLDQNVSARNAALSMALLTFMEDAGVLVDQSSKTAARQSTNRKKKPLLLFTRGKTNNVKIIQGHQFLPTHYNSPVYCDYCDGLLWGLGHQGLTCQLCGFNVHQRSCNQSLKEPCRGEAAQERSRASAMSWKPGSTSLSSAASQRSVANQSMTPSTVSITTTAPAPGHVGSGQRPEVNSALASPSDSTSSLADSLASSGGGGGGEKVIGGSRDSDLSSRAAVAGGGDLFAQQPRNLRERARNSPLSQSGGAADAAAAGESALRRHSVTSVGRAKSLNYQYRPPKYDMGGRRRDTTDSLTTETAPMRSPSLNDIPTDLDASSDGHHSPGATPEHAPDPEMEYAEEAPAWLEMVTRKDPKFLKNLSKTDKSRQGLIHELIHTEATHLKKLKLILNCFFVPIGVAELLPKDQESHVFPELHTLIEHHRLMLGLMRAKMDPDRHGYVTAISEVFSQTMGPQVGEEFVTACSLWVSRNQDNQDYIRRAQANMPRFAAFMQTCESKEVLNRLPLTALTATVMHRLTKYPLLLEGIKKHTLREADQVEYANLEAALVICRNVLSAVNTDVQQYENSKFLQDVQTKLETKELEKADYHMAMYTNIDLSLKKVVHRSDLLWRVKRAVVPVHALLLTDLIVLLEYNENRSQYHLRVHDDFGSVVRVNDLHVRSVAIDKKSFYLVDLKGEPPKMYSLQALTQADCQKWLDSMTKVTDEIKSLKGLAAAGGVSPSVSMRHPRTNSVASSLPQGRPLPKHPRPPVVVQHSINTPEVVPATAAAVSDDEETAAQKEDDAYDEHLRHADQLIERKLGNLSSPVSELAPASSTFAADQRSPARRRATSVEPVLQSCVHQAQLVSHLAQELMQPQSIARYSSSGGGGIHAPLQPANYQLVDATQQLSLQLASMQALIVQREKAIEEVQTELDSLREKSKALGYPSLEDLDQTDGVVMEDDEESDENDGDDVMPVVRSYDVAHGAEADGVVPESSAMDSRVTAVGAVSAAKESAAVSAEGGADEDVEHC